MHAVTTVLLVYLHLRHPLCLCSHEKWMSGPNPPGQVLQSLQITPPPTQEHLCYNCPFYAMSSIFLQITKAGGEGKEQEAQSCLNLSVSLGVTASSCHPFSKTYKRGFYTSCPDSCPSFPRNPLQLDSGPRDNKYRFSCCQ